MRTNIEIDEKLIADAMKAMRVKTKRDAVTLALEDVLRRQKQISFLKLQGKIDGDWDIDAWRRD